MNDWTPEQVANEAAKQKRIAENRLPRTVEEIFGAATTPFNEANYRDHLQNSPDNYREFDRVRRGE